MEYINDDRNSGNYVLLPKEMLVLVSIFQSMNDTLMTVGEISYWCICTIIAIFKRALRQVSHGNGLWGVITFCCIHLLL